MTKPTITTALQTAMNRYKTAIKEADKAEQHVTTAAQAYFQALKQAITTTTETNKKPK